MLKKNQIFSQEGFTVVELIIVIVVVGILVTVGIVSYGPWRQNSDRNTVKSDLMQAASAMQDAANFSEQYPASLPDSFESTDGVVITGGKITNKNNFCLSATKAGMSYFVTKDKITLPGTCPSMYFSPAQSKSYSAGATEIKDLSGNDVLTTFRQGNQLGVVGPTYSSDAGGVLNFAADNSYITTTNVSFGQNTTWATCAKTTASTNSHNMFMGRHLPYFGSYTNGTSVIFSNTINGVQSTISSASPVLPINQWYCYAFTTSYNGTSTTMAIYVNGVFRTSQVFTGAQTNVATRFTVGDGNYITASPYTWYPFTGQVSDVAVYPRTLTASEIKEVSDYQRSRMGI